MVNITRIILTGIIGALAVIFIRDAAAKGLGTALSETGTGFGAFTGFGQAIQSTLTGIGVGTARLFDPLFTLKDLVFGPQAGIQTSPQAGGAGGVQEGSIIPIPQPETTPQTAVEFSPFVDQQIVSREFAQRFSFQAPALDPNKPILDVSSIFNYLSAGGITPAETTLAKLIEQNAQQFPEFFG